MPLERTREDIAQDERISGLEKNLLGVHKRLEALEAKPKGDDRLAKIEAVVASVKRILGIKG